MAALAAATLTGGCSSAPMGTLTQGVAGPFMDNYEVLDATKLQASSDTIDVYSSTAWVQAVVDSVLSGDTVTAALTPGGVIKTFAAPQDGDVGLLFDFTGPFSPGTYSVAVTHGSVSVGIVNWTIAGDNTGGTP